jgi:hypothetical protein
MRSLNRIFVVAALAAALPGWAGAQAPSQNANSNQAGSAIDQVVDRITQQEQQEVKTIRQYNPLIETYIQDMKPDKEMGMVPVKDHYFLGLTDLKRGVVDRSMLDKKTSWSQKLNPLKPISGLFSAGYVPEGFLEMIFIDPNGFDRQHYHFDYLRKEFLGEVRCLVFDVTPLPHSGNGRFKGRMWVEDQNYTPVRFNGVFEPAVHMFGFNLHFDSWRVNAAPGLWLPAYIYSEETDLHDFVFGHVRYRSQTRLWGYALKGTGHESEFSEMKIDAPSVKDQPDAGQDNSPIDQARAWQQQAEINVIDRLTRAGLIAPTGEVDKVLETVVNNIEVTNNIDIQPEIRCRVLLTSTLETFSIGHTIVISRGLLDVLPDEANLAAVLAHEMGHVLLGQPLDDRYAFNDQTMFPTEESIRRLSFHANQSEEEAAGKKGYELLQKSPYKDKLATVGLFMRQLDTESKQLTNLISPHLGNPVFKAPEIANAAPQLEPAKLDQIAALPLGARIKMNPWNDQVELLKSKPPVLFSQRDKMPFAVTPFFPFLTRFGGPGANATADPAKQPDIAKKEQQQQQQQQQPQQPQQQQPQ